KKGVPSPLAPESDEEKADKKPDADSTKASSDDKATADRSKESADSKDKDKEKPKEPPKVEIDFDKISQRILAMPIPARNYFGLSAGKEGEIYLLEGPPVIPFDAPPIFTAYKFAFK